MEIVHNDDGSINVVYSHADWVDVTVDGFVLVSLLSVATLSLRKASPPSGTLLASAMAAIGGLIMACRAFRKDTITIAGDVLEVRSVPFVRLRTTRIHLGDIQRVAIEDLVSHDMESYKARRDRSGYRVIAHGATVPVAEIVVTRSWVDAVAIKDVIASRLTELPEAQQDGCCK